MILRLKTPPRNVEFMARSHDYLRMESMSVVLRVCAPGRNLIDEFTQVERLAIVCVRNYVYLRETTRETAEPEET